MSRERFVSWEDSMAKFTLDVAGGSGSFGHQYIEDFRFWPAATRSTSRCGAIEARVEDILIATG